MEWIWIWTDLDVCSLVLFKKFASFLLSAEFLGGGQLHQPGRDKKNRGGQLRNLRFCPEHQKSGVFVEAEEKHMIFVGVR